MSRYFIFLPSLMLLRWILSVPTVKSTALGNSAAAVFLLAMPFFVLSVVVYHVGLDVEPCVEPNEVLPCVREGIDPDLAVGSDDAVVSSTTSAGVLKSRISLDPHECTIIGSFLNKLEIGGIDDVDEETELALHNNHGLLNLQGGSSVFYCEMIPFPKYSLCTLYPFEYMSELAVWIIFFSYRLIHLPVYFVFIVSATLSMVFLALVQRNIESMWYEQLHSLTRRPVPRPSTPFLRPSQPVQSRDPTRALLLPSRTRSSLPLPPRRIQGSRIILSFRSCAWRWRCCMSTSWAGSTTGRTGATCGAASSSRRASAP